jgi:hypothetical protein
VVAIDGDGRVATAGGLSIQNRYLLVGSTLIPAGTLVAALHLQNSPVRLGLWRLSGPLRIKATR